MKSLKDLKSKHHLCRSHLLLPQTSTMSRARSCKLAATSTHVIVPNTFSFQNVSSMNRFQSNLTFCNCLNLKTPTKIIVFLYFWVFTRDYRLNTLNWNYANPSRFSFQNISSMNRFQSNLTFCNCLNLKTPAKIVVFLYFLGIY